MNDLPPKLAEIRSKLYLVNDDGYEFQDPNARLEQNDVDYLENLAGIKTDVHRTCIACQARQIIKYWDFKQEGFETNRFNIPCSYIPKSLPKGSAEALKRLTANSDIDREKALLILKAATDPVAWAELMFGFDDRTIGTKKEWYLRPYQKEQLRCSSRRLVIREGRRSGKTFIAALKLLHLVFNLEIDRGVNQKGERIIQGPEIMIVTPYQSQVSNIFNEMEMLLKRSVDLRKEVTTGTGGNMYVKTPFFRMEFANGAVVRGFVSGVGTKVDGSGGGTMRGQNADIIYLDEMDMIPDEVLDKVVMPILLTRRGTRLFATSTPIGKRGKFFNWCIEDVEYKEDYLPSSVLPQWPEMRLRLKRENTAEAYAAEYMAHFIEGSHGVFKPRYVYAARQDYTYEDSDRQNRRWWRGEAGVRQTTDLIFLLGIDWNKNAGTEFVVIAFDPNQQHWFVCEAVNVPAGEFSAEGWKKEVIRLNYKWQPHYIYADEGYGHTIIEDLKLMSQQIRMRSRKHKTKVDVETEKLVERLVAFNFSQRVELRSPIDGQIIVKTGKEFLVENTVRIFETMKIWYPEADDALRKQLLNYVVLRRSQSTNKPVYGCENDDIGDHRLDALMLALGAFTLELGIYSGQSMTMPNIGLVEKDELRKRHDQDDPGEATLRNAKLVNGLIDMFHVKNSKRDQAPIPQRPRRQGTSRGNIRGEKPSSVFEEMFERAGFSPQQGGVEYVNQNPFDDTPSSRIVRRRRSSGRGNISKGRK